MTMGQTREAEAVGLPLRARHERPSRPRPAARREDMITTPEGQDLGAAACGRVLFRRARGGRRLASALLMLVKRLVIAGRVLRSLARERAEDHLEHGQAVSQKSTRLNSSHLGI